MNHYFSAFDYILMSLYALALVGMALYLKKRASGSLDDYLIGGRKIPWWAIGISGTASWFDLTGTAIVTSFLFMVGPLGLFIEFRGGVGLVLPFMMIMMGKWHRRSGCLTIAEWNIFRFGDGWGGRFAQLSAVLATVLGTIGMISYLFYGVGQFLSMFLPFSPMTCALLLIGVASIYTMISGFYGVIFTDMFQAAFIFAAAIYISLSAFGQIESFDMISREAALITGNSDWGSASPQWHTDMPNGYKAYEFLLLFAAFYLLRNVIGGLGLGADPKYFGARSDRECGTLSFLWACVLTLRWPLMMGIAVMGIFLMGDLFPNMEALPHASTLIREAYPAITATEWGTLTSSLAHQPEQFSPELIQSLQQLLGTSNFAEKIKLLHYEGGVNAEQIVAAVLKLSIPQGFRGLLFISLVAASMSTFDSNINLATGVVVRDVYQKYLRPKASTKELIYASWTTVGLLVLTSFAFATTIRNINDIWAWIVMGLTTGLMAPTVLRFYWWRFNGSGFGIGTISGLIAALVQRTFFRDIHELWGFVIVLAVGTLGTILGALLTKPTDRKVLTMFYLKTRPFGFWKPLKKELAADDRLKMEKEHRNDVLAIPFALIWQVAMFMTTILIVIHNWNALIYSLIFFATGGIGLYVFWYRKLPAKNKYDP